MALGILLWSGCERVSSYEVLECNQFSYTCPVENSGEYRHYHFGYQEDATDAPESTAARLVPAEELDDEIGANQIRESLNDAKICVTSTPTVLESGSVVAIAVNQAAAPVRPGCIYAETVGDLANNPTSCWYPLPGPPETIYQVATGLSHAILLSQSANPGFNQVLGVGDNRHRAALPKTVECRQPPNQLSAPRCIEDLCGIEISGISAGGSRSAAWSDGGEGWIWGKGIEGIEAVELSTRQVAGEEIIEGDNASPISQIAVGDGYEFVLAQDGSIWTRGNSEHA